MNQSIVIDDHNIMIKKNNTNRLGVVYAYYYYRVISLFVLLILSFSLLFVSKSFLRWLLLSVVGHHQEEGHSGGGVR